MTSMECFSIGFYVEISISCSETTPGSVVRGLDLSEPE
jgi:hypothetical protein